MTLTTESPFTPPAALDGDGLAEHVAELMAEPLVWKGRKK